MAAPRSHRILLALCAAGVLLHQLPYADWYIEDAAISFAYARNLAGGEGLVPWPGGERIEGYSNPTWVALLALFELVGVHGFASSKVLVALFSAGCVPLVYGLGRRALPGPPHAGHLFAPIALVASSQFAIWSASALENALFNFVLLAALLRTLVEAETGGRPWSALWFLLLAWTRPDGLLYAAVGGFWAMVFHYRAGRGLGPTVRWLLLFWVPYLALVAVRLWYFAWPLPNTYYAKVGTSGSRPHRWESRGWRQLRKWSHELGHAWYLPVYLAALLGTVDRRARIAVVVCVSLLAMLAQPGPSWLQAVGWPELPAPTPWLIARILAISAIALLLPAAAIGGHGWRARVLLWHAAACSLAFGVYANGDWMLGFRWMSLCAGTTAVLLGVGCWELAVAAERTWSGRPSLGTAGWLAASLSVGLLFPPNLLHTHWHLGTNQETPEQVRLRVDYTRSVANRVFYSEPTRNLEMDMGAHLWWAPEQVQVDMAGLVDIPMAQHTYKQRAFIQEYVFDEQRPHFGHVHAMWARISDFKSYPAWEDYFELPRYRDVEGKAPHPGVWMRRDMITTDRVDSPERGAEFADGAFLRGLDVPTPELGQGRSFFVHTAWQSHAREPDEEFRAILFLSNGKRVHSWVLALGYDFYPVSAWDPDELVTGNYALTVPSDLPMGTYDLGVVLIGPDGAVLPALEPASDPHFAVGEVRFPQLVTVGPRDSVDALAKDSVARAKQQARDGDCSEAEHTWLLAQRQVPLHRRWHKIVRPGVSRALANCWARRADADPEGAAEVLARAHRWDHRAPALRAARKPHADRLYAAGKEARARGDWEAAYRSFSDVLRFAPTRSWARRYAEEARDHRLGLNEG